MDEDEYEEEPWYPEFPGDTRFAFCDNYEVHEAHGYRAINGNTYECRGFSAEDLAVLVAEEARPPCEHGLSAALCGGPMHWYD